MLQKMLRDHDRLRECAGRISDLVGRPSPCDMTLLSAARWNLASTLMQHLAFEDRHLYTKLASDPRPNISAVGLQFQTSLREKFADYAGHAQSWTPAAIAADWPGYFRSAMAFIPDFIARIDREERELYPLLKTARIDTKTPMMSGIGWTRDAFAIKDRIEGAAVR